MSARHNPSDIKNKIKRKQVYAKFKQDKKKLKKERKLKREREAGALDGDAPPKQQPKTLDNKRKFGTPLVGADDVEVLGDEASDEFADYFDDGKVSRHLQQMSQLHCTNPGTEVDDNDETQAFWVYVSIHTRTDGADPEFFLLRTT